MSFAQVTQKPVARARMAVDETIPSSLASVKIPLAPVKVAAQPPPPRVAVPFPAKAPAQKTNPVSRARVSKTQGLPSSSSSRSLRSSTNVGRTTVTTKSRMNAVHDRGRGGGGVSDDEDEDRQQEFSTTQGLSDEEDEMMVEETGAIGECMCPTCMYVRNR